MEKPLDFVLRLSLEEMALRKAVVDLWSQPDILDCMENFFILSGMFGDQKTWKETVEDWVKEKVFGLVIPALLKKRMNRVVELIGLQILKWKDFLQACLSDHPADFMDLQVLKQLCWTSAGTVDYRKTAEKLISLQTLKAEQRFEIACAHFMIDYLPNIWNELSGKYKRYFNESIFGDLDRLFKQKHRLFEIYCGFLLKGKEYKFLEIFDYSYMLKLAVSTGNKAATEYFFTRLSNEDRNSFIHLEFQSVNRKIYHKSFSRLLKEKCKEPDCYLLSQMTAEQQMHVIRENPDCLFHTLLQWPWQDLFLDKIDLIWSLIPEGGSYRELLYQIEKKISYGAHYFPELFQEFFRRSPSAFKKQFIDAQIEVGGISFFNFIRNRDKETIRVIFRNLENEDRVRFMSNYFVFSGFRMNLESHKNLVKLCVREALPYKEDRENVELLYMTYLVMFGYEWEGSPWQQIFEFRDKTNRTCVKKRKLNNETKAKKIKVGKKDETNRTSVQKRKLDDETLTKTKNITLKKKKDKTKTTPLQKTKSDNETLTKATKITLKKTMNKTNRTNIQKKSDNATLTKAKKSAVKNKSNTTCRRVRKSDNKALTKTKSVVLKKKKDKTNTTENGLEENWTDNNWKRNYYNETLNAKTTVMKKAKKVVKKN